MPGLSYRLCQSGDEERLTEFHQAVFHVQRSSQFWAWKYWNNPAGHAVMALALDGEEIVGRIGVNPTEFKVGDKRLIGSQAQDIAILPKYRKGTPLFRLEKLARQESEKTHAFNYGFSIKKTYRISTKTLNFRGVCPIPNLICILNTTPLLAKKLPNGFQYHQITRFDQRFDRFFWQEIAPDYEIMTIRESEYLNWRYIDIPHVKYDAFSLETEGQLKGFIVLQCVEAERRGRIIDLIAPRTQLETIELLVAFSIRYFLQHQIDTIDCWMLEHTPVYFILQKQGFLPKPSRRDLIVRSVTTEYPTEHFLDPSKWYITQGDCD